ncbi:hypothetical protein [Aquibium sp. ELW1220]|jgi:drug/metabolite transporter (DMT)-like permease|uniref:hypothetical protein n=1 Tax=Aquibium sp. ELW1220 TaxID=2976766 RepID=UPI0025AFB4C3|nr:hypothetical protein [Aquibium sp. ELW1220]MDN2582803.1 hypothetical protein [Aquibium sp. ELW1220]
MRILHLAGLFFSAIGLLLAITAYFGPLGNTGVDGSIGALLALIGTVATTAGIAAAMSQPHSARVRTGLTVLIILAASLTAVAAYFLMQFALAIAMVLALLGHVVARSLDHRLRRTA